MRALLQRQDWKVMTASSGVEALNLLLVHDIDLVLLDVQMPDMDCFEVARLMSGSLRPRRTPIIFLSATEQSQRSDELRIGKEWGSKCNSRWVQSTEINKRKK